MEKERELYLQKHIIEKDIKNLNSQNLKKLIKSKLQELENQLTSPRITIAKKYLPKLPTEEEIIKWININIDIKNYKNKMQAMGPLTKQFKECDGNFLKKILMNI